MNWTRLDGFPHYCTFLHKKWALSSSFLPVSTLHNEGRDKHCSDFYLDQASMLIWPTRSNIRKRKWNPTTQSNNPPIQSIYIWISFSKIKCSLSFTVGSKCLLCILKIDLKMLAFNLPPRSIRLKPWSFVQTRFSCNCHYIRYLPTYAKTHSSTSKR